MNNPILIIILQFILSAYNRPVNKYAQRLAITLLVSGFLYLPNTLSQTHTVFLLGNLGDVDDVRGYADNLKRILGNTPNEWTLVLNGDLLDAHKNFREATHALDLFLSEVSTLREGNILIVPGDRDWDDGEEQGWSAIRLLEDYLKKQDYPNVDFPLKDGCPGPEIYNVMDGLSLMLLNTQWINHSHQKPMSESGVCQLSTEESILEEVESIIDDQVTGNLMVVGHYPINSNGKYGGRFPWYEWILPVPGISHFVTSFRQNVGTKYETVNEYFLHFRDQLRGILSDHFSLIYASGHEHNIEIIRDRENVMINSGSVRGKGYIRKVNETIEATTDKGLVAVTYYPSGLVQSTTFVEKDSGFLALPEQTLFQAPCIMPQPTIPVNHRLLPCTDFPSFQPLGNLDRPERITMAANPNYAAGKGKIKWLGKHYRDSWTAKVNLPVLDLDSFQGGIDPIEVGGGRQTKSLKFIAPETGLEYVFRSVDKDPSKALDRDLRSTVISLLIQDQTTTQQPYGALTASYMLDHLDVLHAQPILFAMPNDTKLGIFGAEFGGMMGLLEDRPVDPKAKGVSFAGADDIKRSLNLFRRMFRDRDNIIDVEEFVRARVFDMLVGDWGKHEDNWKWAGFKKDKGYLYRPVPRDRDHVFSLWDGILPWLADREWAKPSGEHFDFKIKGLRSLMWQARHLDRFVAAEAGREDWSEAARFIQDRITDQVIDSAVAAMPSEIYHTDGHLIAAKLKTRIRDLGVYATQYYTMLARQVDVVGSNKHERFEVLRKQDGSVDIQMFKLKGGEKAELYYDRSFSPRETEEIRLFGMDGDDQFVIRGESDRSILIRVVPGDGQDEIRDYSKVKKGGRKTLLYEKAAVSSLENDGELRRVVRAPDDAYRYNRTRFAYPTYFPIAYLGFSSDYGVSLNGGVTFTNQRYAKPDFSSQHSVQVGASTIGNAKINYDGQWRHVVGKHDLIAGIAAENRRRFRYFFGAGNETTYDAGLLTDEYYTLQYTSAAVYLGLQRSFWKNSFVNFKLNVEANSGQTLENTITDDETTIGVDPFQIGKLSVELDLDFRDRPNLPTKGSRLYTTHLYGKTLNSKLENYQVGEGFAEFFSSFGPFTLGLRAGGSYSFHDVPYYDRPTIGQNRYLKGFRRNRFTGDGAIFFNSDLRLLLLDRPSALIPHKFGIRFFLDRGKVTIRDKTSKVWHDGYGVGIYFVPLKERFSLHLSTAFSKEEKGLIIFGVGRLF